MNWDFFIIVESQSLKAFKNLCNEDKGLTNLNFEFDILVCSKANLGSLGWEEGGEWSKTAGQARLGLLRQIFHVCFYSESYYKP